MAANRAASAQSRPADTTTDKASAAYRYRIAFGAWINDMRLTPLPLENWPAPHLDDETIRSVSRAMDLQASAGFNMLDAWGLFATYGWPPDITSAVDPERRRRIEQLTGAARQRGIEFVLGLGTYSWGYDRIIEANPKVRGKNPDGTPHAHAMCGATDEAFEYVRKIIDFALGQFDFGGVHLESCDLGCCFCPQCAGKDGVVGYNVRINQRTADYIKSRWPEKTVYVITINWVPPGKHFTAEEKARVAELGKHVDCIFDQGHNGYHVAEAERREFISCLKCAYGTSGGLWLYPDCKWDRASYFLPHPRRTTRNLIAQHAEGVRGCMYYQGPVNNPGTEVNIAVGGRVLKDVTRNPDDVLADVLESIYQPRNTEAHQRLVGLFQRAEDGYFSQWQADLFKKVWGIPVPGEFKLDQRLFGTTPGPATYLKEPCLDAKGRAEYRKTLVSVIEDVGRLKGQCADQGRLENIRKSCIITLNLLNTVSYCMNEAI